MTDTAQAETAQDVPTNATEFFERFLNARDEQNSSPKPEVAQPAAAEETENTAAAGDENEDRPDAETDQPQADAQDAAPEVAEAEAEEAPVTAEAKPTVPEPKPDDPAIAEANRKAAEADAARLQYLNQLNTLVPQLQAAVAGEFSDIKTWEDLRTMAENDPSRYNRFVIRSQELQQAQRAQADAVIQARTQWLQAEQQKLAKELPNLDDKAKAEIVTYARKVGYSDQQMAQASAQDVIILHRAMQFEKMQADQAKAQAAAKKIAEKKVANVPPVQKPATTRQQNSVADQIEAEKKRLRKSGRVDDAALIFQRILN